MAAKLGRYDADALVASADYRRAVTRADPMMFALVYLPHHIRSEDTGFTISFSQFHLDLFEQAKQWMKPLGGPRESRDCYVAPRNAGKSTLAFLLLPMWAAAHGWVRYLAAFADSATQAESHLMSFKMELDENKLLRNDFPDLCSPARRQSGVSLADSQSVVMARSGFIFEARGITSSILGMKRGDARPDMILLDDIEPKEGQYSIEQKAKRLKALIGSVFRLRITARVVITGTVTMHGSIIHDLVRMVTEPEPPETWPIHQKIRVHYYPAIITDPETGEEDSWWPEYMSFEDLSYDRHTADFKMHMMNQPVGGEGAYWTEADFRYGEPEGVVRTLLAIDPSISNRRSTQDETGLAVVGWSEIENKCVVKHVEGVKLTGTALRDRVLQLLVRFPEIRVLLVEKNQGGELWLDVFHHMPDVKVLLHSATEKKEVRIANAAQNFWQRGRVFHAKPLPAFEEQAAAYPRVTKDDLIDAAVAGVSYFLAPVKKVKSSVRVQSYL
ncbi:hypothetical protein GCM10017691_24000 [Pseudonocardia petroleophila]|uniref:Phage terminase-like protein, large subunit, contains N-terminal HTH domain n=1 Tax=Pseudonocardia petroleophila TaxID=37331 RepID=A0A7G7MFU3_9PSEU|nr:hypothetical protein [Pseudonocardia petroleophila]QNG51654.1 hypothetical protein H6H00_26700 [Pseudonocardia petroleophila]